MIRKGNAESWATFSDCERYRYEFARIWEAGRDFLVAICLNPSKADEKSSDPTCTRMINRAKEYGYGGFVMLNLFGYRATDPSEMRAQVDPVGSDNDAVIQSYVGQDIVCGWGCHGTHQGRAARVLKMLRNLDARLYYLQLTKNGIPGHPLYISYKHKPQRWFT